jgi:hypothetical protein
MTKTKNQFAPEEQARRVLQNLEKNFYGPLEKSCQRLMEFGIALKEEDTANNLSVYSSLFLSFVNELTHMCHERRTTLMPYLLDIAGKAAAGHNCLNCADDCESDHDTQVGRIENDQYAIRDMFARLQKVSLPIYSEEALPESYSLLRKELVRTNNLIFELFYYEEATLIPLILETQKKINAVNRNN